MNLNDSNKKIVRNAQLILLILIDKLYFDSNMLC